MRALLLQWVWKSRVFGNVVCIPLARDECFHLQFPELLQRVSRTMFLPRHFRYFCAISLILAALLDN